MATKKKSTKKKTVAKKATKKVTKKVTPKKKATKKVAPKKKVVKKTSKKLKTPSGSYTIPQVTLGPNYWRDIENGIKDAIKDGYAEIAYYDSTLGLRLHVKKDGKVIIETGWNRTFANAALPSGYELAEYDVNKKKINTMSGSAEGMNAPAGRDDDYDDDDDDDYDEDDDDDDDDDYDEDDDDDDDDDY